MIPLRAIWLGGVLILTGCYESPEVTLHQPGQYKGTRDPLLVKQQSPEQQARLRARLGQGQTDR